MVLPGRYETIDEALTAFEAQSKPVLKEAAKHRFFVPESTRKRNLAHRMKKRTVKQGRRY